MSMLVNKRQSHYVHEILAPVKSLTYVPNGEPVMALTGTACSKTLPASSAYTFELLKPKGDTTSWIFNSLMWIRLNKPLLITDLLLSLFSSRKVKN